MISRVRTAVLSLALVAFVILARAQPAATPHAPNAPGSIDCPVDAQSLPLTALYGRWEARIEGVPGSATVLLAAHPDYPGVRGTLQRADGADAALAGDIDDEGLLTIDESQDGRAITATWSGALQRGSCGREFQGTRSIAADAGAAHFVLRKLPSADGGPPSKLSEVKP